MSEGSYTENAYYDLLADLRVIEAREYSLPLDATRAAIIRASMRTLEMEESNNL